MADGEQKRRSTMHDVARVAGVSQSTVSLVVNGDERVADETRDRVLRAIEALDFRANRAARDLRGVPSRTLGFVTHQMATSPFAGRTILGAQDAAWAEDHVLLVVDTGDSRELTESAIRVLVDQDVVGILYATMTPQGLPIPDSLRHVPSIVVNGFALGDDDFPRVDPSDDEGARIAAKALLDAGHRKILFLNGAVQSITAVERERGFRAVMSEVRGGVDFRIIYGDYEINSGYTRMRTVIDNGEWMPTAVFGINDRVALGALQALTESGFKVPNDVSLIGYDDQPYMAAYLHPALSTVVLPHYEMGKLGVEALLQRTGDTVAPGMRSAHPKLIMRDSIRDIAPVR